MTQSRIAFFDAARGLAIVLALLSHGLATFAVWPHLGPLWNVAIRLATASATPTFILLFGAMLELVYHRRALSDGPAVIRRRLLRRSLHCYLAYLATVAAGVVSGRDTPAEAVAAAFFLDNTRFGNILKFYAAALLVAVALLELRRRRGIAVTVAAGVALWLLVPLLDHLPWPDPSSPFSYLTATLFGRPVDRSWISLFHSQALVVVGMLLGWSLSAGLGNFRRVAGVVLAVCVGIVALLCAALGWRALLGGYVMMRFRSAHHLAYYATALLEGVTVTLALSLLLPPRAVRAAWATPLLILGSSSLFAYTLGSCLLNLVPPQPGVSGAAGLMLSILAPVLVTAVVAAVNHWRGADAALAPTTTPPSPSPGVRYAGE
jgi:hypothetical protein